MVSVALIFVTDGEALRISDMPAAFCATYDVLERFTDNSLSLVVNRTKMFEPKNIHARGE